MTVWIALLRAVNLGVRNKVPMATLRERLAEAGLPGARTHLQSGNVIVSSARDDVGPLIREVLRTSFGLDEPVLVRTGDRLTEIIAANPFPEAAARPTFLRVVFLPEEPPADQAKRLEEQETIRVLGREVYIDYGDRVHGNPHNAALVARRLSPQGTERNWSTITKIAHLAQNHA